MKFSELTKCPFCGCDEFYTNDRFVGVSGYNQRFDGGEAYDNSQMYDGLTHIQGSRAYCNSCFKYLGDVIKDKVGVVAFRKLKKTQ